MNETSAEARRCNLEDAELLRLQASVLSSMEEGVTISDEDGCIVYANGAQEKMFGYDPGGLLGKHLSVQSAYPPEAHERKLAEVMESLREHGRWEGEWLNCKADAQVFTTSCRINAAEVNGRKCWVCVQSDLTSRRAAELASMRLGAIIESSDDAIISKDLNGIITSWNRGAERIFGYKAEEIIGKPVATLAVPERIDEIPNILERLRRGERIDHYETLRKTKDGRVIGISLTVSPIRNSDGEVVGASKIARDISLRQEMQRSLAAREQELSTLLANLPDIICRFDRKFHFLYASPALERATGFAASHYLGKTHAEAGIPAELAQMLESTLEAIFETGEQQRVQFEMASVDGENRSYLGLGVPEFDSNGQVKTVLTMVRDISELRKVEFAQRAVERELMLLLQASSQVLASPDSAEVLQTIVNLARQFVSADAYAVWRKKSSERWNIVLADGLSPDYVQQGAPADGVFMMPPTQPSVFERLEDEPSLQHRLALYAREGIQSMMLIPLSIHGELSGTIVFYWRSPHPASSSELRIASALGNLAAAALTAADLHHREITARERAETSESRAAFLADAGAVLSSSLDYEVTLNNVAKLAVPRFADWCTVDILDESGEVRRVAVHHSDPEKIRLAFDFAQRFPPEDRDASRQVLRSGEPILLEELPESLIREHARSAEHARYVIKMDIRSIILVPMVLEGRSLGIITFAMSESDRRYGKADLETAEELARRAAVAIARARLYRQAKESEERLRLAVEAGKLGIWEWDVETGHVEASAHFKTMLGIDGDVTYSDLIARTNPEDVARWNACVDEALSGSGELECELRLCLPESLSRSILVYGGRLNRAGKRGDMLGGVAIDVTDQREQQEALGRSNEELRMVNADLNQFAYSASHDLQEPLRMVAIYSQMLERRYKHQLDDKAQEYLRFLLQGAQRMELLVQDLLSYTQVVNIHHENIPATNASVALERALQNLQANLAESGAVIEADPLPSVCISETHLMQVFQNLVGNAVKYRNPHCAPMVRIFSVPEDRSVTISVQDNGIGIPAQYTKQVFGIFRRLHTNDKYSGTGIGLAICQRIIERYGGKIWVESEPGVGSTFSFSLPVA